MPRAKTCLISLTKGRYISFSARSRFANYNGMVKDVYTSSGTAHGQLTSIPEMRHFSFSVPATETVTIIPKTKLAKYLKEVTPLQYVGSIGYGGFTIGTDPELFAVDEKGVIIPAFSYLPDKKKAHANVSGNPGNISNPYWDGFQGEWNTPPGYACLGYVTDQVHYGMKKMYGALQSFNGKAKLVTNCVLEIPEKMMKDADIEHAQLGCAPSLNVYDLPPIDVQDSRDLLIRFAGAHMHFGVTPRKGETWIKSIKSLDAVMGMVMTSLLEGLEDPRRRHFYGKAGEYRLPKHGFEYRVPSSALLCHPVVWHLCFDLSRVVVSIGRFLDLDRVWKVKESQVIEIINNVDVKGARKVLERNRGTLADILNKKYTGYTKYPDPHKKLVPLIMDGAKEHLEVHDLAKVWYLSPNARWNTHSSNPNCTVDQMDISWFKE